MRSFKGHTLQAVPVSTKQRAWDMESVRKNVWLFGSVWGDCAVLRSPEISFPGV